MPRRDPIVTPPQVIVRRWTGDRERDTAQAWSHLTDDELHRISINPQRHEQRSGPGARAELKRRAE